MAKKKYDYLRKSITLPDGTRKWVRGKTKAELERKMNEIRSQAGLGVDIGNRVTVAEWAQVWLDTYKRPSIKPSSVSALKGHLNNHILPAIGNKLVCDVKPVDCVKVLSDPSLGSASAKGIRITMQGLFATAVDNHLIAVSPVTYSVKSATRKSHAPKSREPLTDEQIVELFTVIRTRRDIALEAFAMIGLYTGLRKGEILGLNWGAVDLSAGVIKVMRQFTVVTEEHTAGLTNLLKTDASYRAVPIPPPLLVFLKRVKPELTRKGGYLFYDAESNTRTEYVAQKLSNLYRPNSKYGIQFLSFPIHPHLMRHTYASRCIAAGMDVKEVQYLLGHAKVDTTLNVYSKYQQNARFSDTKTRVQEAFTGFSRSNLCVVGG